jgi:hypothetical protein
MAYDPFAPGSGLPLTPAPALAPNNALGGVLPPNGNPGVVPPSMSGTSVPPVMTPGGGGTGAPLQGGSPVPQMPNWQQLMQQYGANPQALMQALHGFPGFAMLAGRIGPGSGGFGGFDRTGYRDALTDWRGQRPQMAPGADGAANGGGMAGLMDWRSQRPSRRDFFAAPGSATTPPAVPGTAPTGVMPINPMGGNLPPDYLTNGSLGG